MGDPVVAIAEAYPFEAAEGAWTLRGAAEEAVDLALRLPLLCIGANAAPERLAAKLRDDPDPVPLVEAVVHDHAVVFAAHFARYGSLPATLVRHAGARARVFLAFVTPAQLELLDESEGVPERYRRIRIDARIEPIGASPPPFAFAYEAVRGPLRIAGRPVRIAEIPTAGTDLPALTQPAVLRLVHRHLAPGLSYAEFVRALVEDEAARAAFTEALAQGIQPSPGGPSSRR